MNLPPLGAGDGLGNSFALARESDLRARGWTGAAAEAALAQRACGTSLDGLLVIGAAGADGAVPVRIVNRDGSGGGACLNGLRVAACASGADAGVFRMTGHRVSWRRAGAGAYTLDLGVLDDARFRAVEIGGLHGTAVDFWNPHAIFAVAELDSFPLAAHAARCAARADHFPHGVNVEIVKEIALDTLRMRVCERGVGETAACGSGAVAAALARWRESRSRSLEVRMKGGSLVLRRNHLGAVELTGDARVSLLIEAT
jgi:diaminopimelate epimerase